MKKSLLPSLLPLCSFLLLSFLTAQNCHAQEWSQVNNPPFYKDHSNGFGFGDKAYIFEGDSDQVWEYNPSLDQWTNIATFPGGSRALAIGEDWNGKYYFGFGFGDGGALNDLWEFNPVDTSFTQLPDCPCEGRGHPALVAHKDKIIMGTGSGSNGDLDDMWEFDLITQEWRQLEDLPGGPRHHPFQFGIDDYVFIGGGHLTNWFKYHLETSEMTPINNLPLGRVAGAQFDYAGLGFLLGGDDRFHVHVPAVQSFMSYDYQNDIWTNLPPLPNGSRWACSAFIVEDILYFFGGIDSDEEDNTMWKFDMSYISCAPPNSINLSNLTDVSANLNWSNASNSESDTVKWRILGENTWNIVADANPILTLENLEACTEYEYQIFSECGDITTNSEVLQFKTDGCCTNPVLEFTPVSENVVDIVWPEILASDEYELRWRVQGETDWTINTTAQNQLSLQGLQECTVYEAQIKSICQIETIDFGETFTFFTKGCGACTDLEYCGTSELNTDLLLYIDQVVIDSYTETSGYNEGYESFATPNAEEYELGSSIQVDVHMGTDENFALGYIYVWLDLNADGLFTEEELMGNTVAFNEVASFDFEIPFSAQAGLTKMRITALTDDFNTSACEFGENTVGEIEDYCIRLLSTSSTNESELLEVNVYPNPATDVIYFDLKDQTKQYNIQLIDQVGRKVFVSDLNSTFLDISHIPSGMYFLEVSNEDSKSTIKLIKD